MRDLSLFAGAGGGILAGEILGWRTTHAVEIDPFARKVLALRWPDLQISEDVREFNGEPLRGKFDVVSGGFPCQDISSAGKRLGINGPKSGLWFHFARIIEETEPPFAFVENSPRLRTNGLDQILRDLASLGFDAEWSDLSAQALGAPHRRNRMWILATHPQRIQLWEQQRRIGGTYGPFASLSLASLARSGILPTITVCGNYRAGASLTSADGLATRIGGPLSPQWVEWFMGWPIDHTDLDVWETGRFLWWRPSHLSHLQNVLEFISREEEP